MELSGKMLGNRYELIEEIGNGGMATVYKAKCHILHRFVAVKILKDEYTTDEEFIKRFNTEAQSVASLTHPNIVSVYDVGKEGNLYYIVMELIQGKTLKEIIKQEGGLSWKWSVNIAIQIASALETAHKNNIVHRDIKPHNIIITEDGIAKVTDFGIAKAVSNATITAFGTTMGSVHYFSPEHARGGYTDEKSDIYSLGVVLYEMLTSRVPFDADTPVSVALKHMQEEPVEPITYNSQVPTTVNNIVLKAMKKEPVDRYQSATAMLADLRMALKDPEGSFVNLNKANDFPTQHVPFVSDLEGKAPSRRDKKGNEKKKNILLRRILIFGAAPIALLTLIIVIAFNVFQSTAVNEVDIPNLIEMSKEGKTIDEIKAFIEEKKLKLEIVDGADEDYSATIPKDEIYKQEPEARYSFSGGAMTVKEGSTIKIWVSKGEKIITIPANLSKELVGKTEAEIKARLESDKLELNIEVREETIEEENEKMESGKATRITTIEGQSLPAEIAAGSTIVVYISKGIEQITVPDLMGMSEADAKQAITNAKLQYKSTVTTSDSNKANGVIDYSPKGLVDKNTPITITVNNYEAIKSGTITINVKSLAVNNKIAQSDGEGGYVDKEVTLVVTTEKNGQQEQVANRRVSILSTSEIVNIENSGTVTIKVQIDGIVVKTVTFNLNSQSSMSIS